MTLKVFIFKLIINLKGFLIFVSFFDNDPGVSPINKRVNSLNFTPFLEISAKVQNLLVFLIMGMFLI